MLLGSGAVSQQKWRSWWVGGDEDEDEDEDELGSGHTEKTLCREDMMRGRRWVRILDGKEEEVTREVLTHCRESLVTLEGHLDSI